MSQSKSFFFPLLITFLFSSNILPVKAKVFQSRTALGTCAGNMPSSGPGPVSEERKALEKKCEIYDDKERSCKSEKNCKWAPRPQVCEAISEDKPDSEEDTEFCEAITDKRKCERKSTRCVWGYKSPSCSAVNSGNKDDVEFCEKFDGTSEDKCESTKRCAWD